MTVALLYKHGTFDIYVLTIEFAKNLTHLVFTKHKACDSLFNGIQVGSNRLHGVSDKMPNNI